MKDTVILIEVPDFNIFIGCDCRGVLKWSDGNKICYNCFKVYYKPENYQKVMLAKAGFDKTVRMYKNFGR